jgi:hypothetical protein
MLIPIMVTREQIDSLYSIFILDPVFIMPAFCWWLSGSSEAAAGLCR